MQAAALTIASMDEAEETEGESVGDRIRRVREERGITQSALADAVGVRQPTMWRYEMRGMAPSAETLDRIATTLGVSAHYLLHGAEAPAATAEPDPPHWQEFLEKYEHVGEFDEVQLADIKGFSARQLRVRSWMDYVMVAETVRRARPSAIFEAKKAEREAQKRRR